MKSKWKWLSLIISIAILTIALLAFDIVGGPTIIQEYIKHEQPSNLAFSFSMCNKSTYPPESINSKTWSGDTLKIDVTITPNCGTTWLFGAYKLVGENELILGYKTIAPGILACDCNFKASYEISGIKKQEYKIIIKEYAFIHKNPVVMRAFYELGEDIVEIEEL